MALRMRLVFLHMVHACGYRVAQEVGSGRPHFDNRETAAAQIEFGFRADPEEPVTGVRSTIQLFDFTDQEVRDFSIPLSDLKFISESSLAAASSAVSRGMNLDADITAFSANIHAAVDSETGEDHTHRQQLVIREARVPISEVTVRCSHTQFVNYLAPLARQAIENDSPQDIIDAFGAFYARRITMGGILKSTFRKSVTALDTNRSLSAEVHAEGAGWIGRMGAGAHIHNRGSTNDADERIHINVIAAGGDTRIWLRANGYKEMQDEWAASINDSNLFCIKFELRPIWEIVRAVNMEKGQHLEALLRSQWTAAHANLLRLDQLPQVSGGCGQFSGTWVDDPHWFTPVRFTQSGCEGYFISSGRRVSYTVSANKVITETNFPLGMEGGLHGELHLGTQQDLLRWSNGWVWERRSRCRNFEGVWFERPWSERLFTIRQADCVGTFQYGDETIYYGVQGEYLKTSEQFDRKSAQMRRGIGMIAWSDETEWIRLSNH